MSGAALPEGRLLELVHLCIERHGARLTRALCRRYGEDQAGKAWALAAAAGVAVEQEVRAHRERDELTILECARGCRATKKITALTPEGIADFAAGMWFATSTIEVDGFARLAAALEQIQRESRWFVVRGRLIKGRRPGRIRRLIYPDKKTGDSPYLEAARRRHLAVDLDSFALSPGVDPGDVRAVAEAARSLLPAEFRGAACWGQLTAGATIKPGGRCRLWFWCNRPVSDAEAKRWLEGGPVDHSLYVANAPHYVAAPIFAADIADPVPVRSTVLPGAVDAVAVPALQEEKRPKPRPAVEPRAYEPPRRGLRFNPSRPERYMLACLRDLAAAPTGRGRDTCIKVACRLFGLAKAGALDPADVAGRIKGAMLARGWDADEAARGNTLADINRALDWAWQRAEPWSLS